MTRCGEAMSRSLAFARWPLLQRLLVFLLCFGIVHTLFELWWWHNTRQTLFKQIVSSQQQALIDWYDEREDGHASVEKTMHYVAENILELYRQSNSDEHWLQRVDQVMITALLANSEMFQQLRLLDGQGRELRRFDMDSGRIANIPQSQLQDKRERYYIHDMQQMPLFRSNKVDGAPPVFYWSPIDLNVEGGVIERPLLPVQRCGLRLTNDKGEPIAMLVVNVISDQVGKTIWRLLNDTIDSAGLIDDEGYWLFNTGAEPRWGRQLQIEPAVSTFAGLYEPQWAWMQKHSGLQSIVDSDAGVLSVMQLRNTPLFPETDENPFYLYAQLSGEGFEQLVFRQTAPIRKFRGWAFLGYLLLSSVMVIFHARIVNYRQAIQRNTNQKRVMGSFNKFQSEIPIPMLLVDEQLNLLAANLAACRLLGYSQRDLQGMEFEKIVPATESDRHLSRMHSFFSNLAESRGYAKQRIKCRRSNGRLIPVEMSLNRLVENDVVSLLVTLIDLESQLGTEQRLATALENADISVQLAGLGVFSQSERDGPLLVDAVMARHLDVETRTKQLSSLPFNQFLRHIGPFDREVVERRFDDLWSTGGSLAFTMHTELNQMPSKVLSLVIAMVYNKSGELSGLQGVAMDVTEFVRNEQRVKELNEDLEQEVHERTRQLESALAELESFSYTVSHDLRSPLRSINGFANMLERAYADKLDEKNKGYLEQIKKGALVMGELIDDLLMLSRVSRNAIRLEICNLSVIANTILARLQAENPQRQLAYTVEPSLLVLADAGLMRILLTNLIENAWKFTVDRSVAKIELFAEMVDGHRCIVVSDNGVGIPPQHLEDIFKPFQRQCDTKKFSGNGIGLAIARRILDVHDGEIWAESIMGEGSKFYILVGSFRDHAK